MTEEVKPVETPTETPEEEVETTPVETPTPEAGSEALKTPVVETPETVNLTPEEHADLVKKAEDGDNYKKEAQGYRDKNKKDRIKTEQPIQQNDTILTDYKSKHANVMAKYREDIEGLTEEQWSKIKFKVQGTLDGVYLQASGSQSMVAEPDLEREMKDLIGYAKGDENNKKELKKAKLDGQVEAQKADSAEIVASKSTSAVKKGTSVAISDEARAKAEASGGEYTEEEAQKAIDAKKERDKEYAAEY